MRKRLKKKTGSEYYSVCEYADKFGVCEETVRRMIRRGELAAVRIGRSWRIRKEG